MSALLVVVLALTSVAAGLLALATRRHSFPTVMLDPYGSYSQVRFPTWAEAREVRFPDRLVAVNGVAVSRDPSRPNAFVGRELADTWAREHAASDAAILEFERSGNTLFETRPLARIGANEIAFFYGLYSLVGWAVLASGVVVLLVARRRAPAFAYAAWAFGTALFFCTFYDYHSTARLVPLFNAGAVITEVGALWLAWAFPAPPLGMPWLRRALVLVSVAGLGVSAVLIATPQLPFSTLRLRASVSQMSLVCFLALVAGLGAKLAVSSGEARAELRSAVHGLVSVPLVLGVGFGLLFVFGSSAVHLLLPLLTPVIPFAIAYAIIRHGALRTRAVLPLRLVLFPLGFFALALGLVVWLALRYARGTGHMDWLLPAVSGLLVAALVVVFGHRLFVRMFFRAAAAYRPTIDQLSDRMSRLRDEDAISRELVLLTQRFLAVDEVQVQPAPPTPSTPSMINATDIARLTAGELVRDEKTLLVPLRFSGDLIAILQLGRKAGGALFTSEDISLLRTMASLGAVALHHARALAEVEAFRVAQAEASRDERSRVVDTLSAEIAHEIGHPLRYFRSLFQDRTGEASLDAEEVTFARREVERMGRMLATLETLEIAAPRKEEVALKRPAEHAVLLLRDLFEASAIQPSVDVPDEVAVSAEHDALVQVISNLLRNAAQAAGPRGKVGVRAGDDEGALFLDIWDNGPGISEEVRATLFRVWGITTRKGGKGLGLMVVTRILTHWHWKIDFFRDRENTVFRIRIPADDVVRR